MSSSSRTHRSSESVPRGSLLFLPTGKSPPASPLSPPSPLDRKTEQLHRTQSSPPVSAHRAPGLLFTSNSDGHVEQTNETGGDVVQNARDDNGAGAAEERQDLALARRFMNMSKSEPWSKGSSPFVALPANWWFERSSRRPWQQGESHTQALTTRPQEFSIRRRGSIQETQEDRWVQTRSRVTLALRSVLGTALDVTHEALIIGSEVLNFAPVPGLQEAAKVLLSIWEAVQLVETNRLACLRLTERCADILLNVREEIHDAGDLISAALEDPLQKLTGTFEAIYVLMHRMVRRPFLKRYLRRDETLIQINACHVALTDALSLFSFAVQMRSWRQHQAAELRQQEQLAELLEAARSFQGRREEELTPRAGNIALPPIPESRIASRLNLHGLNESDTEHEAAPTTARSDASETISEASSSEEILESISRIVTRHQESDWTGDVQDLRQIMREALATSNDAQMLQVLQVHREEMPEAIKTLQRALERVSSEHDPQDEEPSTPLSAVKGLDLEFVTPASTIGTTRPVSIASLGEEIPIICLPTSASGGTSSQSRGTTADSWVTSVIGQHDTLDREFIEGGIDCLRRLSGTDINLPSWTITRYEIDLEEKVGIGFFSDVYKGTWRNRTIAVKILAPTTPRSLFEHEMAVWKKLKHPNVLPLWGASSTLRDPPWFFVSPYMKNGNLVQFLKRMVHGDMNPVKMAYQIAKGMAYLHSVEMLHGDLKGTNVLINDDSRCVLSDFGLSEMKSEAYRLSGTPRPHGALRWQAPELISGENSGEISQKTDIYAFAVLCVEILSHGALPWPHMDDDTVRHAVITEDRRPIIPLTNVGGGLIPIIQACWNKNPAARPSFSNILKDVRKIRGKKLESPLPPPLTEIWDTGDNLKPHSSPDPNPTILPDVDTSAQDEAGPASSNELLTNHPPISRVDTSNNKSPKRKRSNDDAVIHQPAARQPSSIVSESPTDTSTSRSSLSKEGQILHELMRFDSPPPADEISRLRKNENRYRNLLRHDFHASLKLPLWEPSPVQLGAVGYLSKPAGSFVTLFNAFDPLKTSGGRTEDMPSLYGYGQVKKGSQQQYKRTRVERGLDTLQSLLSARSPQSSTSIARSYAFSIRAGQKSAFLYTENTIYRYMDNLNTPKAWFKANVNLILKIYAREHRLQKEDLFLVFGSLNTPDYGLFVNHNNPDGQVIFSVFTSPKNGQDWGAFAVNTDSPNTQAAAGSPWYAEDVPGQHSSAEKVSVVQSSKPYNAILLARLRFRPDSDEPTSL